MDIPKLLLIQACRGEERSRGISLSDQEDATGFVGHPVFPPPGSPAPGSRNIVEYSDMIIARSTIPGYVSFRNTGLGSWFIQDLCKVSPRY